MNSIIILGAWSLWNHRNRCVFDGINPSLSSIVSVINEELLQWSFAGARGISFLLAQAPAGPLVHGPVFLVKSSFVPKRKVVACM